MRGLRARLLLVFAAAALLPLGAFGLWAGQRLRTTTQADFERRLAQLSEAAEARVDARVARDRAALGRMCEHDLLIDRLLVDLASGSFTPDREQEFVSLLPTSMRALGFDKLTVLRAGEGREAGTILGAGDNPDRAGAVDRVLLAEMRQAHGTAFVPARRVLADGRFAGESELALGCTAARDGVQVAVMGARFLNADYLTGLSGPGDELGLWWTGSGGELPEGARRGGGTRPVHAFADARGETVVRLVAVADDARERQELATLTRGFGFGLGAAGALALLFALLAGLRVSRPLREVEAAVQRVIEGDLESTVDIHGKGDAGRVLAKFNEMTEELRATRERMLRAERIAAWREIARRIAHEIKNPLSPIQLSIETMRKTWKKQHPDFEEIFEESTLAILEEVGRMKRIVTEFSDFARMPRPRAERVDVNALVEHVVGLHAGGDVAVEAETTEPLELLGDSEQLTQVLMNLVQNATDAAAARHGQHGGRVRVVAKPDEHGVSIEVLDNGPGIPAEDRLKVFEPYFTTKSHGTGLGLAICERIVGDHGGRLSFGDGIDGGAGLSIWLPLTGPPAEIQATLSDAVLPLTRKR